MLFIDPVHVIGKVGRGYFGIGKAVPEPVLFVTQQFQRRVVRAEAPGCGLYLVALHAAEVVNNRFALQQSYPIFIVGRYIFTNAFQVVGTGLANPQPMREPPGFIQI